MIGPMTGDFYETIGRPMQQAAELFLQKNTQAGNVKIGGKSYKITLKFEDDGDQPDQAVAVAQKLINQENVVALVGLPLSRNAIPVAQVAETARVPMISTTSSNPNTTVGKKYVFRIIFVDDFQGQVMAGFARSDLKAQQAAVLYDIANPYSKSIAEIIKKRFEVAGGQIVAFETYTTDASKNLTAQLQRIKNSKAEVLFLPNDKNVIPDQARKIREIGIKSQLIGGDTWEGLDITGLPELEGGFFTTDWHPDIAPPPAKEFIQTYRQAYAQIPDSDAVSTYDALGLLIQAMRHQGKVDSESIRQGLSTMGVYQGVSGNLDYRNTGDPTRSVVVLKFQGSKAIFYKQVNP